MEKHILITRYDPARAARGEMLNIDDILEILATPLLGIIPESQDVLKASNVGTPVTLNNAESAPARAYIDAARRLMGEEARHGRAGRTQGLHGSAARTEGCMSMRLLRLFSGRKRSAPVARERLQILLAHERGLLGQSDLLATLREEILAVVSKHIQLDPDKVMVKLERGKTVSTLEVDIEVPNNFDKKARRRPAHGRLTRRLDRQSICRG